LGPGRYLCSRQCRSHANTNTNIDADTDTAADAHAESWANSKATPHARAQALDLALSENPGVGNRSGFTDRNIILVFGLPVVPISYRMV
jgi:hypothetical protein